MTAIVKTFDTNLRFHAEVIGKVSGDTAIIRVPTNINNYDVNMNQIALQFIKGTTTSITVERILESEGVMAHATDGSTDGNATLAALTWAAGLTSTVSEFQQLQGPFTAIRITFVGGLGRVLIMGT